MKLVKTNKGEELENINPYFFSSCECKL